MTGQGVQFCTAAQIPHLDLPGVGSGNQELAVRCEGHGIHQMGIPGQGSQFGPGFQVPHLHGAVIGCGNGCLSITAQHHGVDWSAMAPQGQHFCSRLNIPRLESVIIRGCHHPLAIQLHRDCLDGAAVAGQGTDQDCTRLPQALPQGFQPWGGLGVANSGQELLHLRERTRPQAAKRLPGDLIGRS